MNGLESQMSVTFAAAGNHELLKQFFRSPAHAKPTMVSRAGVNMNEPPPFKLEQVLKVQHVCSHPLLAPSSSALKVFEKVTSKRP